MSVVTSPSPIGVRHVTPIADVWWNPLRTTGTILPPNLLLCAKLLTLSVYRGFVWRWFPGTFIPFVDALDYLRPALLVKAALQIALLAAAVSLFINWRVRAACIVLGATLLIGILASRPYFHNNVVFTGLVLLLIGLYEPRQQRPLVCYQVPLVYFGAALNKLMDPDWRSGQFFENWVMNVLHYRAYSHVSGLLPPLALSALLDWAAIVTEFSLAVGFLIRRTLPAAIVVGVVWHTTLLLIGGSTFGIFYYAMLITYLAFIDWPSSVVLKYSADSSLSSRVRLWFTRVDIDRRLVWFPANAPMDQGNLARTRAAEADDAESVRMYSGSRAYLAAIVFTPFFYFAVLALVFLAASPAARQSSHFLRTLQ
jgi:hypothetical protein